MRGSLALLSVAVGAAAPEAGQLLSESLCFDEEFTRQRCCEARDAGCFRQADGFTYEECCRFAESWWADVFPADSPEIDSWLYTISDFYTDAQYGQDFGYYYRGRVLLNGSLEESGNISGTSDAAAAAAAGAAEEEAHPEGFAHYTTFPMALSPHFGAVVCRKLFVMWTSLGEPEQFPVLEFGAGSGQLASDIRELCGNSQKISGQGTVTDKLSSKGVEYRELGKLMNRWGSRKFLRFRRALQYAIVERSLALVQRQRRRGHAVVVGDAQEAETTCSAVREDREFRESINTVVISNELIDAFAPAKLRLTLGGEEISDCSNWQETRVLHVAELGRVGEILGDERSAEIQSWSDAMVSGIIGNSVVMKTAQAVLEVGEPEIAEQISIILAMTSLADHGSDLRLPLHAHHMVLRLRRDRKLRERVKLVYNLEHAVIGNLTRPVVLSKEVYREIRKSLKGKETLEISFINGVVSRRVNGPLTARRCGLYQGWMRRNRDSISRVQEHYKALGYSTSQFGVRLGEEQYMKLVDCLMQGKQGYVMSIDYGANFEALANSISSTPLEDGVSVPPIPPSLLAAGLPSDCQSNWLRCPGFIDYTSFIDFTNIAKAGEELGFQTVLYGPQSSLERNLEISQDERRNRQVPPKYEIKEHLTPRTQWRHVISWYGNENLPGVQRWTSFKVLIQAKNVTSEAKQLVNEWTVNWPISVEHVDSCFRLDFTAYPQTDVIWRTQDGWRNLVTGNFKYGDVLDEYNDMYEEAHLAVQLTDFLEGALGRQAFCAGSAMEIAWWKIKNSRWSLIWNEGRIAKILDLLYKDVYYRNWTSTDKLEPGICIARRKFAILCGAHPV